MLFLAVVSSQIQSAVRIAAGETSTVASSHQLNLITTFFCNAEPFPAPHYAYSEYSGSSYAPSLPERFCRIVMEF